MLVCRYKIENLFEILPNMGPPTNIQRPLSVNSNPKAAASRSVGMYSGITSDQYINLMPLKPPVAVATNNNDM